VLALPIGKLSYANKNYDIIDLNYDSKNERLVFHVDDPIVNTIIIHRTSASIKMKNLFPRFLRGTLIRLSAVAEIQNSRGVTVDSKASIIVEIRTKSDAIINNIIAFQTPQRLPKKMEGLLGRIINEIANLKNIQENILSKIDGLEQNVSNILNLGSNVNQKVIQICDALEHCCESIKATLESHSGILNEILQNSRSTNEKLDSFDEKIGGIIALLRSLKSQIDDIQKKVEDIHKVYQQEEQARKAYQQRKESLDLERITAEM